MTKKTTEQNTKKILLRQILPQIHLSAMSEEFLSAKKIDGVSIGALENYARVLKNFTSFCKDLDINDVDQVDVSIIRRYLTHLEECGHNPGGCHLYFRVLRTFFNWLELEEEIENWKNPFKTGRLKPPKLSEQPLEPVEDEVIKKMIKSCDRTIKGLRDRAIIMVLFDTGVRAAELYNMMKVDVDWEQRSIIIPRGKGGKPRPVFFSRSTKKILSAYVRKRDDNLPDLFVTIPFRGRETESINYSALRDIMRDISKKAEVPTPKLHAFRRAFALSMLKAGCDVFTLQRLMGHADLQVLRRYLKQNTADLKTVYDKLNPMDHLFKKRG